MSNPFLYSLGVIVLAGKSTLIKLLLGKEQPDSGSVTIGESVHIVSVGQERLDELNAEKTVFDEISEGLDELELGTQSVLSRAYLSWFGFKVAQQPAIEAPQARQQARREG